MDETDKESNLMKLGRLSHYTSMAILVFLIFTTVVLVIALAMIVLIYAQYPPVMDMRPMRDVDSALYNNCSTVVMCVVIIFLLLLMARFFNNIKVSYTPFTCENVRILRMTASVMVISAILMPLILTTLASILQQNYTVDVEVILLVMAMVVYCLSLVFGYGAALQKESDETL